MKRLGWYSRLCLILTVWWLPISTLWIMGRDMDRDSAFDQMIYRNCSSTADYYAKFDVPKAMSESDKCTSDLMKTTEKRSTDTRTYWGHAIAEAVILNLAALIVALAGYWSVRFILAGRDKYRNSVLTKATDIR